MKFCWNLEKPPNLWTHIFDFKIEFWYFFKNFKNVMNNSSWSIFFNIMCRFCLSNRCCGFLEIMRNHENFMIFSNSSYFCHIKKPGGRHIPCTKIFTMTENWFSSRKNTLEHVLGCFERCTGDFQKIRCTYLFFFSHLGFMWLICFFFPLLIYIKGVH